MNKIIFSVFFLMLGFQSQAQVNDSFLWDKLPEGSLLTFSQNIHLPPRSTIVSTPTLGHRCWIEVSTLYQSEKDQIIRSTGHSFALTSASIKEADPSCDYDGVKYTNCRIFYKPRLVFHLSPQTTENQNNWIALTCESEETNYQWTIGNLKKNIRNFATLSIPKPIDRNP